MIKKFLLFSVFVATPFYVYADFTRGQRYYNEGNYSQAFSEFLSEANDGDYRSQYYIGLLYSQGQGVKKDTKKAVEYLIPSAQKGYADAQSLLAFLYSTGDGVPVNKKKAIELYEAAAAKQNDSARLNLGLAYYEGNGVAKNPKKAIELISQIPIDAERKFIGRYLGDIYMNSSEENKESRAKEYYKKSAELGDIPSFYALAQLFEKEGNTEKALTYYQYAASQKEPQAQYKLGLMYIQGIGVNKKDIITGYAWIEVAKDERYEPAVKAFQEINRNLTITQIEAVKEKAIMIRNETLGKIESPLITEQQASNQNYPVKPHPRPHRRNR